MSSVQRDKDAHDERMETIRQIIEALPEADDDANDAVDKRAYAAIFAAWRDGKLNGTAQEIFEAATDGLDPTYWLDHA